MIKKLAVSSVSVPSFSPDELIRRLSQLEYRGVEWRVVDADTASGARAWDYRSNNKCSLPLCNRTAQVIRRKCEDSGIEIVALSPYLTVGDRTMARKLFDLAQEVGTRRIRIWAPSCEGSDYYSAYNKFRGFLDYLHPLALDAGIELALEIHQNTICSSAALAMRVAEHYSSGALKIIYDIGNLAIEGRDFQNHSLDLMGSHLCHVQVKNARYTPGEPNEGWKWEWCPIEDGVLPLRKLIRSLQDYGFSDWLSIEDLSVKYDDFEKLLRNKRLVESYLCTK